MGRPHRTRSWAASDEARLLGSAPARMDRWAVRENQPDAGARMSQDRGREKRRRERRAAGPRAALRAPGASLRTRACPTSLEERLKNVPTSSCIERAFHG